MTDQPLQRPKNSTEPESGSPPNPPHSDESPGKSGVWTQKLALHLNGGSKFSQLNFELFRDGKPTGIVRITRTSGSRSGYLKTVDEIQNGDATFDILATRGAGMIAWLEAQSVRSREDSGKSTAGSQAHQEGGS